MLKVSFHFFLFLGEKKKLTPLRPITFHCRDGVIVLKTLRDVLAYTHSFTLPYLCKKPISLLEHVTDRVGKWIGFGFYLVLIVLLLSVYDTWMSKNKFHSPFLSAKAMTKTWAGRISTATG